MAEKESRDRANAIQAERQRALDLALDRKNRREEAAEKSRQRNKEKMRRGRGKASESPTRGSSSSLSPTRESKQNLPPKSSASAASVTSAASAVTDESSVFSEEEAIKEKEDKFFADEEAIRKQSLEPSYLPYYAAFENEVIGKYGGSHPAGDICMEPVQSVESAICIYLQKYFLGQVPILNDAECSPKKILSRVTTATQVLVMGEHARAWKNALTGIHNFLRGLTAEEAAIEAAGEAEEDDEAKMKATMKFLKNQMTLKNSELEQMQKEMEAAQKQIHNKMDELHALRQKFSIF